MKPILLTAIAVILSACSRPPVIGSGADPSDAPSRIPTMRHMPVLAGTADYRPVDPKPWIESNERVAPKTGSE